MDIVKWAKFGLAFGAIKTLAYAALGAVIVAAVGTMVPGIGTEMTQYGSLAGLIAMAGLIMLVTSMVLTAVYMAIGGVISPFVKKILDLKGLNQVWLCYGIVVLIAGLILSPGTLLIGAVFLLIELLFIYITAWVLKAIKMAAWIPSA